MKNRGHRACARAKEHCTCLHGPFKFWARWRIRKYVFSSCHERRIKKNSEFPRGIFFTELKTNHLYYFYQKHYAIDIADPSSMQDACYKNFLIDLAHRRVLWLSGRASDRNSEGLRFDSSWGISIFLYPSLVTRRKNIFLNIYLPL